MKKFIKFFIKKISVFLRLVSKFKYQITPRELRKPISDLELRLRENLTEETFLNFHKHLKKSLLFKKKWHIRAYAINKAMLNDKNKEHFYLEFGVWKGGSANFFSKYVNTYYAFDSFQGLNEDWAGTNGNVGSFNLNNKIPKLRSNVKPIVGWVEDTLDDFLKTHKPKINFIHFDMDTYGPTKYTLEKVKPYLVSNAIIIFDEYYNYIGWEEGEYKAFKEVFKDDEYEYKAFSIENLDGAQCVIQIK